MCHVLEHFSWRLIHDYLRCFYSILRVGGVLRVSVPDLMKIIQVIQQKNVKYETMELLQGVLMGGQDHKYNFHYSMFWKDFLYSLLNQNGFKDIKEFSNRPHIYGAGIKDASSDGGFNLNKKGISLNIVARK